MDDNNELHGPTSATGDNSMTRFRTILALLLILAALPAEKKTNR